MSLKLYVVGESSPDPDEWSEWGGRCLVLAESPEQAQELCGDLPVVGVTEIKDVGPKLLAYIDTVSMY